MVTFGFAIFFCLFFFSPSDSRPSTPKSDSELVSKPMDRSGLKNNPHMHWAWGELPQAATVCNVIYVIPAIVYWAVMDHMCLFYCRLLKKKWILVLCKIAVVYVRALLLRKYGKEPCAVGVLSSDDMH